MRTFRLFISLVSVAFLSAATSAAAAKRVVEHKVPKGMYAQSNNPKCGVSSPLTKLKDPEVVAAVAAVSTGYAAGVVFLVGTGAEISESSGGELAKWINSLSGSDWASCADMCIAAPAGKTLTKIEWSDRDGGFGNVSLAKAEAGIGNKDMKDFSGWRNFRAFQGSDGAWVVCGRGTNWSHDQKALKRIRITYN